MARLELVAVLLGTPDALDLAHRLVARFGLGGLVHATPHELAELRGIGPARAARLAAAIALGRRLLAHHERRVQVKTPADAAAVVRPLLVAREAEHFVAVCVNTKNEVIEVDELYVGSLNRAVVRVGKVYRGAIRRQAAGILVAHNYRSSNPEPCSQDVRLTRDIYPAGELLQIELLDSLILGGQRYLSFKERGLGFSLPAT